MIIKTLFITIVLFLLIILIMSIGILFNDKELKGSCGGISDHCNCTLIQRKICKYKNKINF